jgi:DNA-binding NarL/FixJ family response regulator
MSDPVRLVLSVAFSSKWQEAAGLLATRGTVVSFSSGHPSELLAQCRRLAPCVLIAPDRLFDEVNSETLSQLIDYRRSVRVVVEYHRMDSRRAESLILMGCAGLLNWDATAEQAARAVFAVLDGELWLSRKAVSQTLQKLIYETRCHLTPRENQILGFLNKGLKNQEIANRLFISPQTVRWHLRSLYTKLGTHDRNAAAAEPSLRLRSTGHSRVEPAWSPTATQLP